MTETFTNDVTPSFTRSTPAPLQEQPLEQLQNLPLTQQHRFASHLAIEAATEIPLTTTTLQPHQPPLSVYMGSDRGDIKVVDVLRALKNANTIPVLDNFTPNNPQVFVGPANLNPPPHYGKFELPYLSNIESSRIEQGIHLPFFVAPLNFNPPPGYSKIPFPAPHVGSVVVSTEEEMQPNVLFERGTTAAPFPSEQYNSIEPEETTLLPETTTTVRSRGRRPNQYRPSARKPVSNSRQRVTPRPQEEETTFPILESQVTQDFLREPQEEKKRVTLPRRQRVRTTTEPIVETIVTEAPLPVETLQPQGPVVELNAQLVDVDQPQPPPQHLLQPVHPPTDFHSQTPHVTHQPRIPQFQEQQFPQADFRPPPPPPPFRQSHRPQPQFQQDLRQQQIPSFEQPPFVQQPHIFDTFSQNQQDIRQEIQGIFEVPPPPPPTQTQELPTIENNGDSGFQQPGDQSSTQQFVSTEQPISSTQYLDVAQSQSTSSAEPELETEGTRRSSTTPATSTTEKERYSEPDSEKIEKEVEEQVEIPKKTSRFSYPNVPGVKSFPSSTKVRSHVRSRPRGNPSFTASTTTTSTTPTAEEEPSHFEVSATAEDSSSPTTEVSRTTSKYLSHFNRSRKPLRPTTSRTETTTTSPSTRSYTVRPLRRSTLRTSVATKRIRKPTTPATYNSDDDEAAEPTSAKNVHANFAPSAASNEIYDEQPVASPLKPKSRKPYFQREKNVEIVEDPSSAPHSPSTTTLQERTEEGHLEELKQENFPEWNPSESGTDVSGIHFTTLPPSGPSAPSAASAPSGPSAPSAPSGPSAADQQEVKKPSTEERKKASDPELHKKVRF